MQRKNATIFFLLFTVALVVELQMVLPDAAEAVRPAAQGGRSEASVPPGRVDNESSWVVEGLLDDIRIPGKAEHEFNAVYERHKGEIHRILNDNPYMIWETIELVVDTLPALRAISANDGKLYVDSSTYDRANDLWQEYALLASPALAEDLRKIKAYVESRTREIDRGQVLIDLNK